MPRLILLNGAPGCGKHSLARLMTARLPLALALDVDFLQHALGRWDDDPAASRRHARTLAVALIREQLGSGHDVVLSQYVHSSDFVDELEADAGDLGASFYEVFLVLDAARLAERIAAIRADRPDLLQHVAKRPVITPEDAPALVESVESLLRKRPNALRVEVADSPEETLALIQTAIENADAEAD